MVQRNDSKKPVQGASSRLPVWQLKKGMDRRFRSGHPWVYSNELSESPKGIEPGELVELRDARGQFLARGFGNPHSLIAFRALSRDPENKNPLEQEKIAQTLGRAHRLRMDLGFRGLSCRMVFGEADGIPGLIFDRYETSNGKVWVFQAHTAGADRMLPQAVEALEADVKRCCPPSAWEKTAIVLRNDLGVRKLEGLTENETRVLRNPAEIDLKNVAIRVKRVADEGDPLTFHADLLEGQKTGFFLDQFANIELAAKRFEKLGKPQAQIKILDLCSYVGQWGVQLGAFLQKRGVKVEVIAVDASASALSVASQNLKLQGIVHQTVKADVLKDLGQFSDQSYDIVIADPPALIKSRKDIPTGSHAYLQLFTQALRLVRPGGGIVCCSCSALFDETAFSETLAKAVLRNRREVRWVGRGAPSPDHPFLAEFPEGRYLKAWVGLT